MRALLLALLLSLVSCGKDAPVLVAPVPTSGCEEAQVLSDEGRRHVQPPLKVTYETEPPTSGDHYPTWAPTGVHTEPVADEYLVHNLEHGHVIVWHDKLSSAALDQLKAFVRTQPEWVIVMPRSTLPVPIAFTAWRTLQRCAQVPSDLADRARAFFNSYAHEAPEDISGQPLPSG